MLKSLKLHPKLIIAIGGCISLVGILISTFTTSLGWFIFFYGGFSGIGCGTMYMIPLVCGWEHFPDHKGLITGIIVGAYGMGNFVFSQISTRVINPHNADATIFINKDLSYFDWDVASRVPSCLRLMLLIWTIMVVVGFALISRPSKPTESDDGF